MTVESLLRLIAGTFVAASVVLGMFLHPYFFWFTLFVGLNLAQSAVTGWCPMMALLRHFGVRDCVTPTAQNPTVPSPESLGP
jgi:hypothetical protein